MIPKPLSRVVALFLVPCLISDPALGQLGILDASLRKPLAPLSSVFAEQSLAASAGSPRLDIEKIAHATVVFRRLISTGREVLSGWEMRFRGPLVGAWGGETGSVRVRRWNPGDYLRK